MVINAVPEVRDYSFHPPNPRPQHSPITQVCSSLRSELLPYYYKHKTFLDGFSLQTHTFKWLQAIGREGRRAIATWDMIARDASVVEKYCRKNGDLEVTMEFLKNHQTCGPLLKHFKVWFVRQADAEPFRMNIKTYGEGQVH